MAKAKKTAALTLEERLERALVPEFNQPYPVPGNWCWCYWGASGTFIAGSGFKNEFQGFKNLLIPFYKVGSLKYSDKDGLLYDDSDTIDEEMRKHIKATIIPANSIIFAKIGEAIRLNRRSINLKPACIDNNLIAFTPIACKTRYAYYWSLKTDLYSYTNATTVPAIRKSDLESIPFPIAPPSEQQRIVDRIESLFAKLDEAKEKAQAVLDSFETRKAAILHKAFTGELTAKWRAENGVELNSWKRKNLQSVCSMKITDGTHKTPTYCDASEGIPFISAKDVTSGEICWDNIKYIVPELHEELYARLSPEIDDILLAKNGTTGVAAIVNVTKVFDLYVTLALLRPNKKIINPYYLLNVINSPICKIQFDEHLTGIGVPNLHLRDIREVLIPLPLLCEQAEIVRLLDVFFTKEHLAKELCSVLNKIDLIKKSILARAFRGELGTNDPTEESALDLLKSIV